MENIKKYNRKRTLDITVMAMVVAIRLVMEMLPTIKFGLYVQIGFGFIGAAIARVMLGPWRAALVGILVDILGNFFRGEWTILHRIHLHSPCRRTYLRILLIRDHSDGNKSL